MTKQPWIKGLLISLACGVAMAADAERKPTAKEVASAYFESLLTGDVDKANELSAVPFSLDRKAVLRKRDGKPSPAGVRGVSRRGSAAAELTNEMSPEGS